MEVVMSSPLEFIPPGWPRGIAFIFLFTSTLLVGSHTNVELKDQRMVKLELAGTSERAAKIIDSWKANGSFENAKLLQWWDDYFLIFYSLTFSLACVMVGSLFHNYMHQLGSLLGWLAIGAGAFDFIENRAINQMLADHLTNWPQLSFGCASIKFVILIVCLLYIVAGTAFHLLSLCYAKLR
jgi:hypothetical protein